jgi:DNA-binding MarR family transcriptional regulator
MNHARQEIMNRILDQSLVMKRSAYMQTLVSSQNDALPRAPLEMLATISHYQPISSKELARQLYLTPGAVSQSVDALSSDGYIRREADRQDRRIQYLSLSKKGEKVLASIERRRRDIMEQAMQDLSLEELTVWLKVQIKLNEQLAAARLKTQAEQMKHQGGHKK